MEALKFPPCQGCLVYNLSGLYTEFNSSVNPEKKILFLKRGDFLFHENQQANALYCVQSGRLILSRKNSESQEEIVRISKPGDLLGIDSVTINKTYTYSAAACDPCVVCRISKKEFLKQSNNHPELIINLLKRSTSNAPVSELIT
ncbi:MAG: Crp/Fnr family transcriptional regulator [Bacteroidia bacterium]